MQCYLLLRNNRKSGPFTFEEITAQSLTPADLIWVEGQSVAWLYPTELEALQPFVNPGRSEVKEPESGPVIPTSKSVFVALPLQQKPKHPVSERNRSAEEPKLESRLSQRGEKSREDQQAFKNQAPFFFPETFPKPHSGVWLASVFAGLLLAAGLIKKIVAAYGENAKGMVAAALPVQDRDNLKSSSERLYQNALTTEVVPVDTATMKPMEKAPAKANLRRLVRVEANDYKKGLFGGIKNLRLLITNKSGFVLDKVNIDLEYLKPNGTVIKTEHLAFRSVQPKSRKSLKVAPQNRGVKVACRITAIQSKQNETGMVNL